CVGLPLSANYAASNFALEGFSQALRRGHMPLNIIVKDVVPVGMKGTNFLSTSRRVSSEVADIVDYTKVKGCAEKVYEEMASRTTAQASNIAQYVFRAITDGSAQDRYIAPDVEPLLELRRKLTDEDF